MSRQEGSKAAARCWPCVAHYRRADGRACPQDDIPVVAAHAGSGVADGEYAERPLWSVEAWRPRRSHNARTGHETV